MDSISQVIHDCETSAAIKQAKRVKPLWYGGRWSKYKYGEAWQIDYITLPQTRQGKRYVLTMVEATTGWLETYPVPHATARNTILGLEKQVLWRHGTPERIESDNGTHFKNSLINNWAREHGVEWVYHIPYHAPASGKIERYNGLLKTTLKALGGGSFKNWEQHLAKATWLVNTRGSTNRAGPAQSESLHTVDGEKVPVVHVRGRNEMLIRKDKHLCYGVQMMNVEARNRMDMDHFSLLSRGNVCFTAIGYRLRVSCLSEEGTELCWTWEATIFLCNSQFSKDGQERRISLGWHYMPVMELTTEPRAVNFKV
ncbi:hypothetical protein DUI87_08447 [Hirundo rustica rustica]|uniref:Integrase catalytic domain-containing protein n=1 Tax=Hirundo rustica rustica TaxID=333673 RepID=A0A3M0KSF2_HIRRU|nr:hypothetical protein DUI87_08447 [Hirundo rustica rustica]